MQFLSITIFAALSTSIEAFSSMLSLPFGLATSSTTALSSYTEKFERSVECAEKYGYCDVEELQALADDLEEFQGNYFEHEDIAFEEREIEDRQELANVLKLQAELQSKTHHLKQANLFASDLHEEIDNFPEPIS
mmetsp:Transcript_10838/g.13043  ORF Transcript_10838/g.13043 Transcript_10838/m.13043 type:complete len:135 (-) Transcript_10838:169-573(-)|eukprot:CAMPEP_0195269076 /NCGR_PEP_ID=MMETSP0706-20130129/13545_1 /TAXON_ID=33640 /ORGANISM="Asterionellopsis glacialis, Strain CCMP134" /LENGTH=134 /DNA_ID=CAMNT_0040324099 /DNA_START=111 /DNA_END=515 /DNA_ORIENTATION=-